ncbi:hypothetical protein JZ751_028296 [Albula glossodonta]|uniref:Uncharacterized protein n=1 Tax=Albula glossodonta TaxID=121402 RepID=A0A8T2NBH5_9TELE|nr:hypothetical protein JZ751_028296 [Albula glossodonta]
MVARIWTVKMETSPFRSQSGDQPIGWRWAKRPASPLPFMGSPPTDYATLPFLLSPQGRPLREQQEVAAAVIQRCYRKYKQVGHPLGHILVEVGVGKYALYKKMTQAAILIQSKFRSYHEQKKFQQSRRAAVLIQQYYRSYKECGRLRPHRRAAAAALVQHKLRTSLLTKKQDQAAREHPHTAPLWPLCHRK